MESDALTLRHEVLLRFEQYGSNIGFSFLPVFIFLSFKYVYLSLIWRSFTWNKKIPIKFPGLFLNLLKKIRKNNVGGHCLRRDSNTLPLIWSQTLYRCTTKSCTDMSRTVIRSDLFFPAFIFCVSRVSIFPWIEVVLIEAKIPIKFSGPLISWKTTQFLRLANTELDVIWTSNLQRLEPYGYFSGFSSFQQPFFVFEKC